MDETYGFLPGKNSILEVMIYFNPTLKMIMGNGTTSMAEIS